MSGRYEPNGPVGAFVNALEENLIAFILGAMTLVQFANVVARYGFNSNLLWALETTVFLFAWLVLIGASYAVKVGAHLGVDVVINAVPRPVARVLGLIAVTACVVYAFLLLKGSWDYWAPFAQLQPTTGRWFPTGIDSVRGQGWYEVNDIEMPEFLQFLKDIFNAGERYEKIPRFIPYFVMPLSMALLLFRFLQAAWRMIAGDINRLIVSHELEEDELEEAAKVAEGAK